MSAVADKLDAARGLIEKGWCQHYSAVDLNNREVDPESMLAVRFCAVGAIYRVTRAIHRDEPYRECHEAVTRAIGAPLARWNDQHTWSEVIHAFRSAAKMAREKSA